jgi:serine/threonine protein kinase
MRKSLPSANKSSSLDIQEFTYSLTQHFTPIKKLGIGSQGVVIEAKEIESGRHVALKFFASEHADTQEIVDEMKILQVAQGCPHVP